MLKESELDDESGHQASDYGIKVMQPSISMSLGSGGEQQRNVGVLPARRLEAGVPVRTLNRR